MLVSGGQILAIDKVNTGNTILGDGVQKPLYVNTDLIATTSSVSSVSSTLEHQIDAVSGEFNDYYPKFVTSAGVEFNPDLAYFLKKQEENVVWSGVDLSNLGKMYNISSMTPELISAGISADEQHDPFYVISAANVNVEILTGIIYISNADRASDDNDGLTPNTPVRTLEVAVERFNKYYPTSDLVKFSVIDSYDMLEIDLSKIYAVDSDGYSRYINAIEITSDDSVIGIKGSKDHNLSIKADNLVRFIGDTYTYSCTVESEYIEFNPGFTYRFQTDCILNAKSTVQLYGDNQTDDQGKIVFNNLKIKTASVYLKQWNGDSINLESGNITIDAYSVNLNSIKSSKLSIKSHYLDIENISMGGDVSLIGNPEVSSYSGGQSSVYVSNIIKTEDAWASTVLIKDFDNVNIADQSNTLIDVPGMRIENAKYVYSSSNATGIRVDSDFFINCSGSVSLQAKDVAVDGLLAITADYIGFNSSDGIVSAEEYSLNLYEPNDESEPGLSLYVLRGKRSDVSDPSSEYDDCIKRLKIKFYNVYFNSHIEVRTAEIECQYLSEYANPTFGDLTIISDRVYVGQHLATGHLKLKTNKLEMGAYGPIGIGNASLPSYLQSSTSDPNIIDVGILTGAGQRGAFQFGYSNNQSIDANINVDLMVMSNWNNNGITDQLLCTKSGDSISRGQITGRVGGLLAGSDGRLSPWPNDYKYNCDSYTSEYCTISIDWCTPDKLNFYIDSGAGNDSFTGLTPNSPVKTVNGLKKAMESVGGASAFQCIHVAGNSLGGDLDFSDEYFSSKFCYLEFVSCTPFMSLTIRNLNCSILKASNFNEFNLNSSNVSTMALIDAQYINIVGDSDESTKYRISWLYSKSHVLYLEYLSVGNIYSDCDSCSLNCTSGGTVSVHSKNQISINGGSYSGSVNFISDYVVRFSGNNSLYGYTIVDSPNIEGNIANQALGGTIELRGGRIQLSDGSLNMGISGSGRLWVRNCKDLYLPSGGISFFNFEVDIDAQFIGGGNLSHYGNNPGCLCRINAKEIYSTCKVKLMNDTAYITADKLGIPVSIMTTGPSTLYSTKLVLEAKDCMQGAVYYDNSTSAVNCPVDVELLIHDLYGSLFGNRTSPIVIGDADSKVVNIKATILRDHTDGTWLSSLENFGDGIVSDIQILNKSKQLVAGTGIGIGQVEGSDNLLIYSSTPMKTSIVTEDATELKLEHGVITHIGIDVGVSTLTLTYNVDDTGTLGDTAFECSFALEINPENTTFTQFQIHMITPGGTYNVPIRGLPSAFGRGKRYMGTLINEFATLAEYEPLTLIGN